MRHVPRRPAAVLVVRGTFAGHDLDVDEVADAIGHPDTGSSPCRNAFNTTAPRRATPCTTTAGSRRPLRSGARPPRADGERYRPAMLNISHHERVDGHPRRWHVFLHGRDQPIPVELDPEERRSLELTDEEIHERLPDALLRHHTENRDDLLMVPGEQYDEASWDAPVACYRITSSDRDDPRSRDPAGHRADERDRRSRGGRRRRGLSRTRRG